jgi:hypothetical protein
MEPKREPSESPMSWAEQQLADLRASHPGWEVWYVRHAVPQGTGCTWCARPKNAATSTCQGDRPEELSMEIIEFESGLTGHIDAVRAELERTPVNQADRRGVLVRQLNAMGTLNFRNQVLPGTQAKRPQPPGTAEPPAPATADR